MNSSAVKLIDKLSNETSLSKSEYLNLLQFYNDEKIFTYISKKALKKKEKIYGNNIYIRGLIEISNICKNNCLYCGIRKDNLNCERYRMTKDEILSFCNQGYELGFRTFVLQGGEDPFFTDDIIIDIINSIKHLYPDSAVTLSLGERSKESYQKLFSFGADRYLLRHETANEKHYKKLHPQDMSYKSRINCLYSLKSIGYQTGCGFMIGSPFQTLENITDDIKFLEKFKPEMVGIGPFISQKDTPFSLKSTGSVQLTLFLLSIIRLILPSVLLPATTALATLDTNGFIKGVSAGANVIMLNLASLDFKKKYKIYDGKSCINDNLKETFSNVNNTIRQSDMTIAVSRGDFKNYI